VTLVPTGFFGLKVKLRPETATNLPSNDNDEEEYLLTPFSSASYITEP